MTGTIYPQPIFEGAEKRLELDFVPATSLAQAALESSPSSSDSESEPVLSLLSHSLRSISKQEWNTLLEPAECCIVSSASNSSCDAYLLSESSLFVFDHRLVLKTCGTTKILDAVPGILNAAAKTKVNLKVQRAKYSRSTFRCPEQQPAPYTHFALEVELLDDLFGHLSTNDEDCFGGRQKKKGHAYILGDQLRNALWHVYVAGEKDKNQIRKSGSNKSRSNEVVGNKMSRRKVTCDDVMTLEICMTGLSKSYCGLFSQEMNSNETTERLRLESGIAKLIGQQDEVDDYVFDPCGYSLNSVKDDTFVTIHITPEDNFSYASVEFCGWNKDACFDPKKIVQYVSSLFKPENLYVASTCDGISTTQASGLGNCYPSFKDCNKSSVKSSSGTVAYQEVFSMNQALASYGYCCFDALLSGNNKKDCNAVVSQLNTPPPPAAAAARFEKKLDSPNSDPSSPVTVLGDRSDMFKQQQQQPLVNDLDTSFVKLNTKAETIESAACVNAYATGKIRELGLEDTFYVFDLGNVYRRMKTWKHLMPRVKPFYAVKCNPDEGILSTLATLGSGFDCASQVELNSVLSLGVSPNSVVYANACKRPSDLRHMKATDTFLTTFDCESELLKIKKYHPRADVVLRIRADDPNARCYLGNKYGAEPYEIEPLLRKAMELDLHLVGVSFHVGSGASDPEAFRMAITSARKVFDSALGIGITTMSLLDIGGGFSGGTGDGMQALFQVSEVITSSLEEHFPVEFGNVRVIAEPGRYFSEGACSLYTCVYGKRERQVEAKHQMEYWLTDGLYGSMNCVIYDHAELIAKPLRICSKKQEGELLEEGESNHRDNNADADGEEQKYCSTLFGPTCDGLDTVLKDVQLPRLENGDWILFPMMGAYTISASSDFNGIKASDPTIFYVMSKAETTTIT
jgi:ornithine decarboxylase